jgi:hypothetical protein
MLFFFLILPQEFFIKEVRHQVVCVVELVVAEGELMLAVRLVMVVEEEEEEELVVQEVLLVCLQGH